MKIGVGVEPVERRGARQQRRADPVQRGRGCFELKCRELPCRPGIFRIKPGEFAALYPHDETARWQFCAPRIEPGSAELAAIRPVLLERAMAQGCGLDDNPDLHLVVDGERIVPDGVDGLVYRFSVRAGSAATSLVSRSVVPAEIEADARDIRRLGVAVERMVLSDGELSIEARHVHAGFSDGFHADEGTHRWTDGLARLPEAWLRSFPGSFALDVHLTPTGLVYPVAPPRIGGVAA